MGWMFIFTMRAWFHLDVKITFVESVCFYLPFHLDVKITLWSLYASIYHEDYLSSNMVLEKIMGLSSVNHSIVVRTFGMVTSH